MGQPIRVYTKEGDVMNHYSPHVLIDQVEAGIYFLSPPAPTSAIDPKAVQEMKDALGQDEEE